jgi:hypothetical protein
VAWLDSAELPLGTESVPNRRRRVGGSEVAAAGAAAGARAGAAAGVGVGSRWSLGGAIDHFDRSRSPLDLGPEPARVAPRTRVAYVPTTTLLARVDALSGHVDEAVLHVDALLGATDKDGAQLVNNLSRAAMSFGDVADQVRQSKVIPQLDQASADLAAMAAYARSGHGTIGLAVMDPTVYEQMVTVLGGVARSRILRALVRFAILNDDGQKAGQVVDAPDAPKGLPPDQKALPAGVK